MSHAIVNPDREFLIQCPYDPVHMISQMRFPYHLIKCRKNHNGKEYGQCPYEARHVIPKSQLNEHVQNCDKRSIIEPQLVLDDSNNIELSIPPSKAHSIQATLSNEWDLEMPSAAATNTFVSQTVPNTFQTLNSNGWGVNQTQQINSFASSSSNSNGGDQRGASGYQGGASGYQGGASGWNNGAVSYDHYPDPPSRSEIPRKPNSMGMSGKKKKNTNRDHSPSNGPDSVTSEDSNDPVPNPSEVRRPFSNRNKDSSINSPAGNGCSSYPPKTFGRGRGGRGGRKEDVFVVNSTPGPDSYALPAAAETTEGYDFDPTPPPQLSFRRGRGGYSDQPVMRRPGKSSRDTQNLLERERGKLLKKIRETKQLEERLANGEVLEDNQVSKVAKLASMQNELNKICKQLEEIMKD